MEDKARTDLKKLLIKYFNELKEKTDRGYPAFSGHNQGYIDCLVNCIKDLERILHESKREVDEHKT